MARLIIINQGRMPPLNCPTCGAVLNGYTGLDRAAFPHAGDVLICAKCLNPYRLDESRRARRCTPAELLMLNADPMFPAMVNIAREARRAVLSRHN